MEDLQEVFRWIYTPNKSSLVKKNNIQKNYLNRFLFLKLQHFLHRQNLLLRIQRMKLKQVNIYTNVYI
jgi:hypothetical protein